MGKKKRPPPIKSKPWAGAQGSNSFQRKYHFAIDGANLSIFFESSKF